MVSGPASLAATCLVDPRRCRRYYVHAVNDVSPAAIVGIFLVRDEDVYLERAVRNVLDFCDRILITDHCSRDRTREIATRLSRESDKIEYTRIRRTGDSHALVQPYAGTKTWVFGVDGDEIYDPAGLARFRAELLDGTFDQCWTVLGNVLNCTALDLTRREATGYLAPPCRSMTKLYNFGAITRWDGPCLERLHGGTPIFRPGVDASRRRNLHEEVPWDDSNYRCLHTCFLPRSSRDVRAGTRLNIMDINARGWRSRAGLGFLRPRSPDVPDSWKREKYMRGDLITTDVSSFFPPTGPPGRGPS